MTMRHERMRALRWGRDLLDSMAYDAALTDEMRSRAQAVWERYPDREAIEGVLSDRIQGMPLAWVDAWIVARSLFLELRRTDGVSAQLRHEAEATLRHFAEKDVLRLLLNQEVLAEWLDLEAPR